MVESNGIPINNSTSVNGSIADDLACVYASDHLTFRRDIIDPLSDQDSFEIVTPAGRFRMTRGELYEQFAEVVGSSSYRDLGQYHYPMIPYKAFRFLVREDKATNGRSEY